MAQNAQKFVVSLLKRNFLNKHYSNKGQRVTLLWTIYCCANLLQSFYSSRILYTGLIHNKLQSLRSLIFLVGFFCLVLFSDSTCRPKHEAGGGGAAAT